MHNNLIHLSDMLLNLTFSIKTFLNIVLALWGEKRKQSYFFVKTKNVPKKNKKCVQGAPKPGPGVRGFEGLRP